MEKAILKVFNDMLDQKRAPKQWNEEWVKLLHKGGSKLLISNYRGISIASVVGKLFVKILTNRLAEMAEREGWLPEAQGAFRKGRGMEDHLFVLHTLLERARMQKENIFLGFVDLRKAYDSVDRAEVWRTLEEKGVDKGSITIIRTIGERLGWEKTCRTPYRT